MKDIRKSQEKKFRELYNKFKGTPMEVSSESAEHKKLRYSELIKIVDSESNFTIHDVGMGVGNFFDYLKTNKNTFTYSGSEILKEYVEECRRKFPNQLFYHRDLSENPGNEKYDYLVLSGVFHQRGIITIPNWEIYLKNILKNSFSMSKKGIAVNFISPFVDFYQENIYYADFFKLINFIRDDLSRFFTINHSYALFEFTVFIYRENYIKNKYSEKEFKKYFK